MGWASPEDLSIPSKGSDELSAEAWQPGWSDAGSVVMFKDGSDVLGSLHPGSEGTCSCSVFERDMSEMTRSLLYR